MRDAIPIHPLPNTHRRSDNKRKVRRRIVPTFEIFALLTSLVGGGRFAVFGGRRAAAGGLLGGVTGPSRKGSRDPASSGRAIYGSFVSAAPLPPSFSRSPSSHDTSIESPATASSVENEKMPSESCDADENEQASLASAKVAHPDDPSLWLYHVESTPSTMDEAKRIVEKGFLDNLDDSNAAKSFVVSATSQTNGRGTTNRKWKSSQKGNALFTIGIRQSSWMDDLKAKNGGSMVPLTLLPLKVGTLVAFRIQKALEECVAESGEARRTVPRVTVKWPNDVLLRRTEVAGEDVHEKVAGILIESAQDWFLVGIGINVGYAPRIPSEGADYGRRATSISQYCSAAVAAREAGAGDRTMGEEEYWMNVSKGLARDVAHDLHSWLHPPSTSSPSVAHSGETILNRWKSYVDWDMELTLRDTPKRERVTLKSVMPDGRVVVREVETGLTRTLVADYFL